MIPNESRHLVDIMHESGTDYVYTLGGWEGRDWREGGGGRGCSEPNFHQALHIMKFVYHLYIWGEGGGVDKLIYTQQFDM